VTSRCSIGFRVKSGHAIAVILAGSAQTPSPLARAVVELNDPGVDATRQPFHAGFGTAQEDRTVISRLVGIIERCAHGSIGKLLSDERLAGYACGSAGLVVGSVIDPDTVGNLHIRAHAMEGRLFRTVLEDALRAHGIVSTVVIEKTLAAAAARKLGRSEKAVKHAVDEFRNVLGAPWRVDEKAAAMGAWMVL